MLKQILVIFLTGVLLRETGADIECFLKDKDVRFIFAPEDETRLCDGYVNTLRQKLEECNVTKVNLDELDSHVKEVCTEGTDLRKDVESSKQCFETHAEDIIPCRPKLNLNASTVSEVVKGSCMQRKSTYSCIRNKLESVCGEAGKNVISKSHKATESYMKDLCYLVGGAAANSFFMWIVVLCVSFTMLQLY